MTEITENTSNSVPAVDRTERLHSLLRKIMLPVLFVIVAALIALPWWGDRYSLHLFSEFFYILALAQMWNLLAGYGGLISIGQQAFVGIGGYMLVVFALKLGLNPFLTIPIAGVISAIIAIPIALLMFRLGGAFFAVGTWVIAEICRLVVSNIDALGAGTGISIVPTVIHIPAWWRTAYTFWIALALGVGATLIVYWLLRSRHGLALTAMRDDPTSAASLGVSTSRVKWWVFLVAAAGCGMVGALIFITKLRVTPDSAFTVDWTVTMLFIVIIGGIGTIEGPLIGALLYFFLRQELSDFGTWYMIFLGVLTVVVVLWKPKGLWGSLHDRYGFELFKTRRRLDR